SFVSGADQYAQGTFENVQTAIGNVGSGETVYLTGNVQLQNSEVSTKHLGIVANRNNIIIDGQNYTINGKSPSGGSARVMYINGNNVTVKNLNIINGEKISESINSKNGSGIYNNGSNNKLINVNIINCVSQNAGAGIYNTGTNLLISGSSIIANNHVFYNSLTGNGDGGGIYNVGTMTIEGSHKIINNYAETSGAGIFNRYGSNSIIINGNNNISNNIATSGAGIYSEGILEINGNNIIVNNTATGGGGGIYGRMGKFTINGTNTISKNTARNGGGIFTNVVNFTIKGNNIISYNNASYNGGAIWNDGENFTIIGSNKIINNIANQSGGGIYNNLYSSNTGKYFKIIGNNTISNNIANQRGGGIYNTAENFTISENNNISYNDATFGEGGGIYNTGINFKIDGNNKIYKNTATSSSGIGGGIYNSALNFIISEANHIINNTAISGGGIYNSALNFKIIGNNSISYNIAGTGGGIENGGNYFTINGNNSISYNVAGTGGGIYNGGNNIRGNYFLIQGSNLIENNKASINGGGIFNRNSNNFTISGNNMIFNNTASNSGGGIFNDFYFSVADDERYYFSYAENFTITGNNQIISNNATFGGGIYNNAYSGDQYGARFFTINNGNIITNNTASNVGGGICNNRGDYFIISGENNINNNSATDGGAIYNYEGLNFTIFGENNFILNNVKRDGGAIYNNGDNFTITNNNNFSFNKADGKGGAIYNNGDNFKILGNEFLYNSAVNGSAVYNEGYLISDNAKYVSSDNKHLIYNIGTLYLNKNYDMISTNFEKIYNLGMIISEVIVYYLNNRTVDVEINQNFILNATLTDDVGNCIVGQNVSFVVQSLMSSKDVDLFNSGYYYYQNFVANQYGTYIVNGTYRGGNNLTIKNGVINILDMSTFLTVTKIVDNTVHYIGDVVVYRIFIDNAGGYDAFNVNVIDFIPESLTLYAWDASFGNWTLNDYHWTLNGVLPMDEYVYLDLYCIVNNISNFDNITNTVYVDAENADIASDNVTFNVKQLLLNITKSVNVTEANTGDYIQYNITIDNMDLIKDASNVKIFEYFPNGLSYEGYINSTGNWAYDGFNTWSLIGNLSAGGQAILTLLFSVVGNVTGIINNTVNVKTNQTPGGENVTSNNTNLTNVVLDISKIVHKSVANFGDYINYTVVVKNVGSSEATGIAVTEYWPEGLSFEGYENTTGFWTRNGNLFTLNGVIVSGSNATLTLIFRVIGNVTGLVNNTVNVKSNETMGNNTTSNNTNLTNVILNISKVVDKSVANFGDYVTYTVVIKNVGTTEATGIVVTEFWPEGLDFIGYGNNTFWINEGNHWNLNCSLAPGNNITLILLFKVNGKVVGNVSNTIHVKSNQTPNGENTTSNNTTLNNVSLKIDKIVDKEIANINEIVTYTITIKNTGSTDANNVTVIEYIPFGLKLLSYQDTNLWNHVDGTNIWNLKDILSSEDTVNLTLICRVEGTFVGMVNNTAEVITNQTPGENVTSNGTILTNGSLVIIKEPSVVEANKGDLIEFIIFIANGGTTNVTNISLIEYFPDGLKYENFTGDIYWIHEEGTNIWTYSRNLEENDFIELILFFTVVGNVTGNISNTINVSSNINTNGTNVTSDNVTLHDVVLNITKTMDKETANIGDLITYTISIHNSGSTNATGVVVSEYFPKGLELIDYKDKNIWIHDGNIIILRNNLWFLNETLLPGATVNLTLIFKVIGNFTGIVHNTVNVKSNETGNNSSNNTTSGNTTLNNVTLSVIKSVDKTVANVGDEVIYTITVVNSGSTSASDVVLTEYFPKGMEFVRYVNGTGSWNYDGSNLWSLVDF
ncbi:DUF11 domain-containing protein, partial [Methanobrevibacter sp. OttesenSCG-928-I08]|nr:DUF11 domain-containing protein [Methanobrevibacter sp. OttesenSCG-928-I08]